MTDHTIRAEEARDIAAIADVVEAAFGSPAEARLVEAVRASDMYEPDLALVAEVDGQVVGHVMISGATLVGEHGRRRIVMLSPLAVSPEHQRRGIGAALVHAAVRGADARGEPLVVLEGSPAYYGALGFESSTTHGITITLPSWAPPEAAQVMRLSAYDPALRGHVEYPPAFDDVTEH
jgi:putative acetyltransferase